MFMSTIFSQVGKLQINDIIDHAINFLMWKLKIKLYNGAIKLVNRSSLANEIFPNLNISQVECKRSLNPII